MNVSLLHGEVEQNLGQAPMGAVFLGNLNADRHLVNDDTRIRHGRLFLPTEARMPQLKEQHKTGTNDTDKYKTKNKNKKDTSTKAATKATKLSPNFDSSIYDNLREHVESILAVSTKFRLESTKCKGVVLVCGSNDNPKAKEEGYATCILALKTTVACPTTSSGRPLLVDNPLIPTLGKYAIHKLHTNDTQKAADHLPELILGLCCNNWGMYYGRNALIEALLDVLGPANKHKLSIHSALYATNFNTQALASIILTNTDGGEEDDEEQRDRESHAAAFRETALKYNIGLDTIEKDTNRFVGVSKAEFVHELSSAVTQAVERTMSNDGKTVIHLVLQILRQRCLIQDNLTNKKFRRAPIQNDITIASQKLTNLFAENFYGSEEDLLRSAEQVPGWKDYTNSVGGAAKAILGLFCHSIDVLAGCVARCNHHRKSSADGENYNKSAQAAVEATPDLAERIVLTVLDSKDQRLMEYCFNQIYELMPDDNLENQNKSTRMYLYRRLDDLSQFSTMPCGAVELGSTLKL